MINDADRTDTGESRVTQREQKLSYDAIALKAYFIALDRHARGEEADPLKDWVEAERQLSLRAG
jgi:hypothetical protein